MGIAGPGRGLDVGQPRQESRAGCGASGSASKKVAAA